MGMRRGLVVIVVLAAVGCSVPQVAAQSELMQRQRADKLHNDGNYAEALERYRELALNPQTAGERVGHDLRRALDCYQRLNRVNEMDAFRESVIDVHVRAWPLLATAAQSYLDYQHDGFIVAGEFRRGVLHCVA